MSGSYFTENKYKYLAAKKRTLVYTDKFESFLSVVIIILATIGILRTVLQAIS